MPLLPLLPLLPFYFYKGNMLEVLILKAYTLVTFVTHRNIDNRINLRDRKMLNVNKAIVMGD